MKRPQRYLIRMTIFLMIVLVAVAALYSHLKSAFMANAVLNGLIVGVLLLGVVYIFRQVISLRPELDWLGRLRAESKERLIYPDVNPLVYLLPTYGIALFTLVMFVVRLPAKYRRRHC